MKVPTVNKNFLYITDRKTPFINFYLPSDVEVLNLESITDYDTVFHYTNFNPFNLVENIKHPHFFEQIKNNFPKVSYNLINPDNKDPQFRNFICDQSLEYHSNVLLLLKLTVFYSKIFDFKFYELIFSQKQIELIKYKRSLEKKEDFWNDKKHHIEIFKESEINYKLPLLIVEKIVQNENNYLNIRHDFVKLKEDLLLIHKDLRSLLRTLNDNNYNPSVMHSVLNINHKSNKSVKPKRSIDETKEEEKAEENIQPNSPTTPIPIKNDFEYEDNSNFLYHFMELTVKKITKNLVIVLLYAREKAIENNEMENFEWLNTLLNTLQCFSNFKENCCFNDYHIDELEDTLYSNYNSHFMYYNNEGDLSKKMKLLNNSSNANLYYNEIEEHKTPSHSQKSLMERNKLLKKILIRKRYSLSFITQKDDNESLYDLEIVKRNFNFKDKYIIQSEYNSANSKILDYILCLDRLLYADIKSSLFKIQNNTEKFMIYLELNKHNCSIIKLYSKKDDFLNRFINIFKNKLFYLCLINDDFLPKNPDTYRRLTQKLKEFIYLDIDLNFQEIKELKEKNRGSSTRVRKNVAATNNKKNIETKEVLLQINKEALKDEKEGLLIEENRGNEREGKEVEENERDEKTDIKILLETDNENSLKLENTVQMSKFVSNYEKLITRYMKEIKLKYYKENHSSLRTETLALKEVFSNISSDLSINNFRNKFSSSLLKNIDDTQLININKLYYFFETFLNKLLNCSIEVDTHSFSKAFIINREEFEVIFSELIRDYISFTSTLKKQDSYTNAIEKYGSAIANKKLSVFLTTTKKRLIDYEDNIEKMTNAKLALNSNKLIFEMDNLYRQLRVLKENVVVMEDYIQTYFHEKFFYITSKLRSEVFEIQNKFQLFKNDVNNKTIMNITEEYNNCLGELKSRTLFLTQQAEKFKIPPTLPPVIVGGKQYNPPSQTQFTHSQVSQSHLTQQLEKVIKPGTLVSNTTTLNQHSTQEEDDIDSFFDHFYREIEIETNYNKDINIQRKKNEKLLEQVNQLHLFYRMKIFKMQKKFNLEIDSLKQKLSSNQDLWEKLSIAEKNENVLKEELAKTQKNLASNEEFIKKLQTQIKILHDKNITIEKKLSAIAAHEIISNANQGENIKAKELYSETKTTYVYNFKNNVNLINSINTLKKTKMPEALLVCENLEILHSKYCSEVENKRTYINSLNSIKDDITNSREMNKLRLREANYTISSLKEELEELKKELNRIKAENKRLVIKNDGTSQRESLNVSIKNKNQLNELNMSSNSKVSRISEGGKMSLPSPIKGGNNINENRFSISKNIKNSKSKSNFSHESISNQSKKSMNKEVKESKEVRGIKDKKELKDSLSIK